MTKNFYAKLFFLALFILPNFAFASFSISPINLVIDKGSKISSMTLQNNYPYEQTYQLIVYKIENVKGEQKFVETKELLVTPAIFKIGAGKSQLVRVAVKEGVMYSHREEGYRLAVRELPRRAATGSKATINFVTQFNLPVTIK